LFLLCWLSCWLGFVGGSTARKSQRQLNVALEINFQLLLWLYPIGPVFHTIAPTDYIILMRHTRICGVYSTLTYDLFGTAK